MELWLITCNATILGIFEETHLSLANLAIREYYENFSHSLADMDDLGAGGNLIFKCYEHELNSDSGARRWCEILCNGSDVTWQAWQK